MATTDPRPVEPGQLVYDVGMHNGEDTRRYLEQGFKVVADAEGKFGAYIKTGQLTLVGAAIAEQSGTDHLDDAVAAVDIEGLEGRSSSL